VALSAITSFHGKTDPGGCTGDIPILRVLPEGIREYTAMLVTCRQCGKEFNAKGAQKICSYECREARHKDSHTKLNADRKAARAASSNDWNSTVTCPKTELRSLLNARRITTPAVVDAVAQGLQEFADKYCNGAVNRFLVIRGAGAYNRCRLLQTAIQNAENCNDQDSVKVFRRMLAIENDIERPATAPPVQPHDVLETVYEELPPDYEPQPGDTIVDGADVPEDAKTIAFRGDDGKALL
jgi:hypothetical protein